MNNKKLAINDWQQFSLKKDIENLNKLVNSVCEIGATAIFDIAVAFLAVLFDRMFGVTDPNIHNIIFIVAGIIIVASLLRLVGKRFIYALRRKSITVNFRDTRKYIDLFDNETWCHVMMADSFLDLLDKNQDSDMHRKTFYFSETCFWLNKGIDSLYEMMYKLKHIFDDDTMIAAQSKKVSTARLINLLEIIFNIKHEINVQKEKLALSECEIQRLTANNIYYQFLSDFVERAGKDLKIDIRRWQSAINENTEKTHENE